jgi:hypothetical protein
MLLSMKKLLGPQFIAFKMRVIVDLCNPFVILKELPEDSHT